jgi:hypothetical protein
VMRDGSRFLPIVAERQLPGAEEKDKGVKAFASTPQSNFRIGLHLPTTALVTFS